MPPKKHTLKDNHFTVEEIWNENGKRTVRKRRLTDSIPTPEERRANIRALVNTIDTLPRPPPQTTFSRSVTSVLETVEHDPHQDYDYVPPPSDSSSSSSSYSSSSEYDTDTPSLPTLGDPTTTGQPASRRKKIFWTSARQALPLVSVLYFNWFFFLALILGKSFLHAHDGHINVSIFTFTLQLHKSLVANENADKLCPCCSGPAEYRCRECGTGKGYILYILYIQVTP